MSVYPPNTYCPTFMMETVFRFPSHLLWKIPAGGRPAVRGGAVAQHPSRMNPTAGFKN